MEVTIHALYADDFLHFTNNKALYQDFQKKFNKSFDVKTRSIGVYLGNPISGSTQSWLLIWIRLSFLSVSKWQTVFLFLLPWFSVYPFKTAVRSFLLTIRCCITTWWAVCSVWGAGHIQIYPLQFQSFPCLYLSLVKTTCRLLSTCSGISRGLANWVCATLSPRTVDQWIEQMSCSDSLIQIGLGVRTAGDLPQDIPWCSTEQLCCGSLKVNR